MRGSAAQAVAQRELDDVARELGVDELARLRGRACLASALLRPCACARAARRPSPRGRRARPTSRFCLTNSVDSWRTDSLMNVPGPKTTLTGFVAPEPRARPVLARRAASTPAGTLPEMQPSRPSSRPRSDVSTSLVRSPRDEDDRPRPRRSARSSARSPRSCPLPLPTSVSVAVLGSQPQREQRRRRA